MTDKKTLDDLKRRTEDRAFRRAKRNVLDYPEVKMALSFRFRGDRTYSYLEDAILTPGGPDRATRRLLERPNVQIRKGDRHTGVWVCSEAGMYSYTTGEDAMYLKKGTRIPATWEWNGLTWIIIGLDTDFAKPPIPWWRKVYCFLTGKSTTKKVTIPEVRVINETKPKAKA